jgi:hypothetical protein
MEKVAEIIEKIWKEDIGKEFQDGDLLYEGDLRAAFYHHLRNRTNYKVFAEYDGLLGGGDPDIIIADGEKRVALAVVEFKFEVGCVVYEHDVKKLASWAKHSLKRDHMIKLVLDPRTRTFDGRKVYKAAPLIFWVFACIGEPDSNAFDPSFHRKLLKDCYGTDVPLGRFLLLTGCTDDNGEPDFKAYKLSDLS